MTGRAHRHPELLLGVVVAALVVGILGMHAFAVHTGAAASHSTTYDAPHHSGASLVAIELQPDHPHPEDDGAAGAMARMCLSILTSVAFLALLWLLGRQRVDRWWWLSPRWSPVSFLVRPVGLAAGPPVTWRFSVIRC